MHQNNTKPLHHFFLPSHWPVWLLISLLKINSFLPYSRQLKHGKLLGRIGHKFLSKRRAITRRNLALAFPELSLSERNKLTLDHFEAMGISLIEFGLSRWASDKMLSKNSIWEGKENIQKALDTKRGIILLSAHFTSLEISGRIMKQEIPVFDVVYRRNHNAFINEILRSTRELSARTAIEKRDIKSMIRNLRNGGIVWYAPDQSYNQKQSEVLPFFDVPAMTNTATSTIAKLGNAVVLPFFPRRLPDGGYVLKFLPLMDNFPSDDSIEDTKKYIKILEDQIRLCPEQYFWIHRKYKNLPKNYENFYKDLNAWE
jgi:KDO2-lipid IV(A) lauroyltransferase|tara:strand:+ start:2108 stop:3049 length:942 start_codon:yes stop_codon:yes gene_type:complete